MKRIIITGADGFLGRNLVKKYLDTDNYIIATVYPGNNIFKDINLENFKVVEIDLNNATDLLNDLPENIDIMYHFAWIGVKPEQRDDLDIQMRNINMTMKCMELADALHAERFIMPGSTNEYLYYGKPINKDALPSPSNAYGAVKVALRYLCENYFSKRDTKFIYAIIAGIYAADRKDSNVIYYTIDSLLNGKSPSLTKLEQLWDYVYIDDVVDALVAIGEKGKDGTVYAIGHGDNWKLSNYIYIIHEIIDKEIPLGIGDKPYASDILPCSCIDLTAISNDTGWLPKTDFKDGITKVIEKIKAEDKNNV